MKKPTLNEKFIAYLTLFSGLSISAVAVYYSVVGLTAIFSAAVIPIIIMGTALEISKLVATVWLKQNWSIAPWSVRVYLAVAIVVLMLITSMGIFGFLSKAHSDQNLVSGDVQSKIAIFDEKIKTEKENIEANRKALKQMDEGVDQVLGRSTDEKGADKAVAMRRSQQKERTRLQNEISQSQKSIAELNDARAPIAAEVRKVEAEVGPIKYIAAFFYGATDNSVLERAVTWVIITIIIVFDPLAVILLLASQISFQKFREEEDTPDPYVADVGEKPTLEEMEIEEPQVDLDAESNHVGFIAQEVAEVVPDAVKIAEEYVSVPAETFHDLMDKAMDEINYELAATVEKLDHIEPIDYQFVGEDSGEEDFPVPVEPKQEVETEPEVDAKQEEKHLVVLPEGYIQNEEQHESNLWTSTVGNPITQEEYIKAVQNKTQ
jgi:hypothetical protein